MYKKRDPMDNEDIQIIIKVRFIKPKKNLSNMEIIERTVYNIRFDMDIFFFFNFVIHYYYFL